MPFFCYESALHGRKKWMKIILYKNINFCNILSTMQSLGVYIEAGTEFVIRVAQRASLVKQELLTSLGYLTSPRRKKAYI
jgi:hypothetical protein